jgi:UDP-N-acetylmuramate: L-alanyl-gamma-D-glutamyl-meso-diaminopimelate ligase
VEQFEIFVEKITRGGILVYNEDDAEVCVSWATKENPTQILYYSKL